MVSLSALFSINTVLLESSLILLQAPGINSLSLAEFTSFVLLPNIVSVFPLSLMQILEDINS